MAQVIEARAGFERVGPPLPGSGRVMALLQLDLGLVVMRATMHPFAPAIFVLPEGATAWEQVYLH